MFKLIDQNGDGALSYDEFTSAFEHKRISDRWKLLDIGHDECKELFALLDNGNGEIDMTEVFEGLNRMKGGAQSKDVFRLAKDVERLHRGIDGIRKLLVQDGLTFGSNSNRSKHPSVATPDSSPSSRLAPTLGSFLAS